MNTPSQFHDLFGSLTVELWDAKTRPSGIVPRLRLAMERTNLQLAAWVPTTQPKLARELPPRPRHRHGWLMHRPVATSAPILDLGDVNFCLCRHHTRAQARAPIPRPPRHGGVPARYHQVPVGVDHQVHGVSATRCLAQVPRQQGTRVQLQREPRTRTPRSQPVGALLFMDFPESVNNLRVLQNTLQCFKVADDAVDVVIKLRGFLRLQHTALRNPAS